MYNKGNYKMRYFLLSFILLLSGIQSVFATEIKTSIDRNPVNIDESFQITFTATESPDDSPVFSVLEKNFEILNQSQSSNSSWVNGKSSKSIQWVLNVMAKQTGKLLVPPVPFGNDVSQPVSIVVTEGATVNQQHNEDLFLEVEATPETVFVQSQVLYTLRVYSRVRISQASLNEPKVADALIEKLEEDKNYNTQLNGVDYVVIERKYAIFPQKSGVITIDPLVLTANVASNARQRFNSFFSQQVTQTKRVMSNAVTLNVKAAPAEFTGKRWLPAEHLYLEEKWSGDTENMVLGEPLTRTLTLLAKGATVAQLPEMQGASAVSGLKTYPDQPLLKEKKQADGLISLREEKIAYIASRAGSVTLPAIEIPWFNTKTQAMEVARIPARTVTAIASAQSQASAPEIAAPVELKTPAAEPIIRTVENKFWMYVSIGLVIGWLLTVILLLSKPKQKQQPKPIDNKAIKLKETVKALKQACAENNPLAAKDALLAWGKIKFNSHNLSEVADQSEARLRDEIYLLSQSLYANQPTSWQGKKLFQFFTESNVRKKIAKKTDDALEPLYKV